MKKFLILTGVFLLVIGTGTAFASLIKNGDFETTTGPYVGIEKGILLDDLGDSGNGTWDVYTYIPYWGTYSGPGIEIQKNTIVKAHSGDHYVELDSHGGTEEAPNDSNSGMVQEVWLEKGLYDLSFWYRPRTDQTNDNGIEVLFAEQGYAGAVYLTVNSVNSQIKDWVQFSVQLEATKEAFYGIGFHASGEDNTYGGFIDDVALNTVPEPATMLLLGTALIGLAGLRRRLKK